MSSNELWMVLATVLGGFGTWLMLPHRHGSAKPRTVHVIGFVLAAAAVLLLTFSWTPPGPLLTRLFFYAFAISAVLGALLMITDRNPIHSALWFAVVVLATTGLFLLAGAQFLAAGTVIVYAGAIIVMFLFVIMLAQADGRAPYDRTARAPGRASLACFVLLWALVTSILSARHPEAPAGAADTTGDRLVAASRLADHPALVGDADLAVVLDQAVRPATARIQTQPADEPPPGVPAPHVAGLGATLYTDHLVTVEILGTILFVALVAAAAIAAPRRPARPPAGSPVD